MIRLAIFDMDGTLVNSLEDLADACNRILLMHGLPEYETDRYRYFVGDGAAKLIERVLPDNLRDGDTIRRYYDEFTAYYKVHCNDKTAPYAGIPEALAALRKAGFQLAVASNKPDIAAQEIAANMFGESTFDLVLGKTDTRPTKPDPKIIHDILAVLKCPPEQAVLIGDTNVDVRTGKNADVRVIGCAWGFRGREELQTAGADWILDSPEELPALLAKIDKAN